MLQKSSNYIFPGETPSPEEFLSIPDDLFRLILPNLPLESLCRFRSVSKFFHAAISDELLPSFSKSISPSVRALDFTHKIYYHPIARLPNVASPFWVRRGDNTISALPPLPNQLPSPWPYQSQGDARLGYDPMSKKHKALRITFTTIPGSSWPVIQSHVFVVEDLEGAVPGRGPWRRIGATPFHHWPSQSYVCIGGIVYYTAADPVVVVGFHLGLETFRFIPFPMIGGKIQGRGWELMRYNGCYLVLVDLDQPPKDKIDMWLLEDPSNPTWIRKTIVFKKLL